MADNIYTSEWKNSASIYEVNIRQYTSEGTFNAFAAHLPRLQKMGVKILWLMPVTPISKEKRQGSLGSYYACSDYVGINTEFGGLDDFLAETTKLPVRIADEPRYALVRGLAQLYDEPHWLRRLNRSDDVMPLEIENDPL